MRKTLSQPVVYTGIGLHSGQVTDLVLRPRYQGGIVFKRVDLNVEISASYKNVVNTELCTMLGERGATLSTVEHLMAALSITGITEVTIEVNGPEVPIADGSARIFARMINDAGVQELDARCSTVIVKEEFELSNGDWSAIVRPSDVFTVDLTLEYDNDTIGTQRFVYRPGIKSVLGARTFALESEIEFLRNRGLAQGGSLDNAIVVGRQGILNTNGLRMQNEFAQHKVLDAIGDLYLAGKIQGEFVLRRTGHAANNQILHHLFKSRENYSVVYS